MTREDREETIAAISTPPGAGAISIVRLSGEMTFEILAKLFKKSRPGKEPIDWKARSHRVIHGFITDPDTGESVDEVVVIPYKSPSSYTGEDLAEINCHGSPLITRQILDLAVAAGARLARPGEFTKRAFLNGKLDLTQAEAVLDLIQCKTEKQGRLSVSTLKGGLGERIRDIRARIIELSTRIIAGIDFPEEVGELPLDDVEQIASEARKELERLAATSRAGRFLRDGLRMAIVGKPNVGKSSLLNQLLRFDRAIVTDVPGTTRDSIEEILDINGVPVTLIDTAGIRATDDHVERIGIDRTRKAIEESDLALIVFDVSSGWHDDERSIADLSRGVPTLEVANKIDLVNGRNAEETMLETSICRVSISARTGEGVESLTREIERFAIRDDLVSEAGGSLNQRQGQLCKRAAEALLLVEQAVKDGLPQDCLATDLKIAIEALSEVCGDEITEELITEVFANFCIGK